MNKGTLVLYLCLASPAAALTMHKAHDRFTPQDTIQANDVPVLNISEAPTFFEALGNQQGMNKDLTKKNGEASGKPRYLIIMYGLMQLHHETWPIVQNQLKLAEGRADVDLIVATDLSTRCSEKDIGEGRCPPEWTDKTNEQLSQEIKDLYQPYIRAVFDDPTHRDGGRVVPSVDDHYNFNENTPDTNLLRKIMGGSGDPFLQYDHVLAMRSDASFSHDFDIADVCSRNPGMNFIHGDYDCGCYIHHADSDKGSLACEAGLMRNFFQPKATCEGLTDPPPLPDGFGGSWYGNGFDWPGVGGAGGPGMGECVQLMEFQNIGKRLGSLDGEGIVIHIH